MSEITFVVIEDAVDGGFCARAHWLAGNREIFTEGDTRSELVKNVRKAVDVSFDTDEEKPALIHLHYVRDEVITLMPDATTPAERYPLRGRKPFRFDRPNEPVGEAD